MGNSNINIDSYENSYQGDSASETEQRKKNKGFATPIAKKKAKKIE